MRAAKHEVVLLDAAKDAKDTRKVKGRQMKDLAGAGRGDAFEERSKALMEISYVRGELGREVATAAVSAGRRGR